MTEPITEPTIVDYNTDMGVLIIELPLDTREPCYFCCSTTMATRSILLEYSDFNLALCTDHAKVLSVKLHTENKDNCNACPTTHQQNLIDTLDMVVFAGKLKDAMVTPSGMEEGLMLYEDGELMIYENESDFISLLFPMTTTLESAEDLLTTYRIVATYCGFEVVHFYYDEEYVSVEVKDYLLPDCKGCGVDPNHTITDACKGCNSIED